MDKIYLGKRRTVTVSLDEDVKLKAEEYALKKGITLSVFLRILLMQTLAGEKNDKR